MKDAIVNAPMELKGFWTMVAGSLAHVLGYVSSMEPVQLMGVIVAVAGLVVQVSAYLRNRAEAKRAEAETALKFEEDKRAAELHEARMHFMRRDMQRDLGDEENRRE